MLKWASCEQVEKAGGQSSCDGKGVSGLDIEVEKHDQVHFSPTQSQSSLTIFWLFCKLHCLHLCGGQVKLPHSVCNLTDAKHDRACLQSVISLELHMQYTSPCT